ncbi:uncharacterized protein BKA78DRAFT_143647 [Phyllosticta capitalensis]|uniref:uncharacterized protein n=1 Tax=Phyllosticta capitalensis TaxID=121624 RepID=UPI00312EEE1F
MSRRRRKTYRQQPCLLLLGPSACLPLGLPFSPPRSGTDSTQQGSVRHIPAIPPSPHHQTTKTQQGSQSRRKVCEQAGTGMCQKPKGRVCSGWVEGKKTDKAFFLVVVVVVVVV